MSKIFKVPPATPPRLSAWLGALVWLLTLQVQSATLTNSLEFHLRRCVRLGPGAGEGVYRYHETVLPMDASKTAVVVVDVWDSHACGAAASAAAALIPKLNRTLDAARALGLPVIFAPSGCDLSAWEDKPQRLRIKQLPPQPLPAANGFLTNHPPVSVAGAVCMCRVTRLKPGGKEPQLDCQAAPPPKYQHPALIVRDQDFFIAAGQYRPGIGWAIDSWGEPAQQELWNFVKARGITHLIYMGLAANMCVINREFGMIQMQRLGLQTLLVRRPTRRLLFRSGPGGRGRVRSAYPPRCADPPGHVASRLHGLSLATGAAVPRAAGTRLVRRGHPRMPPARHCCAGLYLAGPQLVVPT